MRAVELGLAPSERIEKIWCDFLATAVRKIAPAFGAIRG